MEDLTKTEVAQPATYAETRRWQRFKVDLRIRAVVTSAGRSISVHGRGSDIGEGGMAAFLAVELAVGDRLQLDVTLPYSQPMKLKAVVRNRDSFRYGLEFVDITPSQAAAITRSCSALAITQ